jgi:hypothetical protein
MAKTANRRLKQKPDKIKAKVKIAPPRLLQRGELEEVEAARQK